MAGQTRIAPDFYDTVRRVNYLVDRLKVRDYLEVGLGHGGTFDNVRAPRKVGVDPHPWSPAVANLNGVCLQTSDEYFSANFHNPTKFDLILLDGLHTAEQTYRDLVNSLHFSHPGTVWLIDDVMPNDKYSALPNHEEAIKQRRAAGGSDTSWHGDVYKVVWMIRTFHSGMTVRTIWRQQPQAVVYFSVNRKASSIKNISLGEIAGLDYDDTVKRRDEYSPGEEQEILDECVRAIKQKKSWNLW